MITHAQKAQPVPHENVTFDHGFWATRQTVNRENTIPAIYSQLEATGRVAAFNLEKEQPSLYDSTVIRKFFDSDCGKWLEAVGYSLKTHPDPELEKQADALIDKMEAAQQPDGYLNTYFEVVNTDMRWRNLRDWHEMYNAGHLIEGAVAYYEATGKRKVLDVLTRFADHIDSLFGREEGKKRGYCGHPEIELALVKLYHATGEKRYLNLSKYFIDERGQQPLYFDIEAQERGDDPTKFWAKTYRYCQAHIPVREQTTATGHAVRACYLYSGMADIAAETNDTELLNVCRSIWDDLTRHQMYITGGLGPAHANEGFTFGYDLPNETAYAETCASIALVFWAQRMFHADPDGRYIDVMERALYNGIMSGVSYEGKHFFYANPLTSYPYISPFEHFSGINTAQHYRRTEWFHCPCCPPNLARLVASIGGYFYSTSDETLFVHLYGQNSSSIEVGAKSVRLSQATNYPWDETVKLTVEAEHPARFTLALRIPGWCKGASLQVNGANVALNVERGYAKIDREWTTGDQVVVTLPMPVERMIANPKVRQDAGQVALQRGPVVYCIEEVDNGEELANVVLPRESQLTAAFDSELFGGVSVITGNAVRPTANAWSGELYAPQSTLEIENTEFTLKAIPYNFWANRAPGEMRVWIRES